MVLNFLQLYFLDLQVHNFLKCILVMGHEISLLLIAHFSSNCVSYTKQGFHQQMSFLVLVITKRKIKANKLSIPQENVH